jgi:hypothetical protein
MFENMPEMVNIFLTICLLVLAGVATLAGSLILLNLSAYVDKVTKRVDQQLAPLGDTPIFKMVHSYLQDARQYVDSADDEVVKRLLAISALKQLEQNGLLSADDISTILRGGVDKAIALTDGKPAA